MGVFEVAMKPASEEYDDSTLLVYGFVFFYILVAFVLFVYARDGGPFPHLPYHYVGVGIAVIMYILGGFCFTRRSDGLQRGNYPDSREVFSFLGYITMAGLLVYGIGALLCGIRYWSAPESLFLKQSYSLFHIEIVFPLAGFYGVCVLRVWPWCSVKPNTIVIADNIAYFPLQEVFLSPFRAYRLHVIKKIIPLPRITIYDVEFKSGDCLPIALATRIEVRFESNEWEIHGNGLTSDALARAGIQWIEAVLRERAKEKTLTEFLTTKYPQILNTIADLPVVWRPDLPAIQPIVINL